MTCSLDASDRVVLDTCTLDHDALVDHLTHDRYRMTPTAAALLAGCDGRRRVGELTAEHASAYGVDPALLHEHLSEFVDELRSVGLVRVRRPWRHRVLGLVLDLRPGSLDQPVTWRRFPATAAGCARATLHAARAVAWSAVVAAALMTTFVAVMAPGVPLAVGLQPACLATAALAGIVAHEVGHLLAVRVVGGQARYAVAGPNQVAVVHDVTDPERRRRVALAGPISGAVAGLAAVPMVALLPTPADDVAIPAAVLLAAGHLAGLMPWLQDGRHLWAARA